MNLLAAVHPVPAVAELRERRPAAGLDAYGGSHDSLHSYSSLHAAAPHIPCTPQRSATLRSVPTRLSAAADVTPSNSQHSLSAERDDGDRKQSNESESTQSSAENLQESGNGRVEFGLHELK